MRRAVVLTAIAVASLGCDERPFEARLDGGATSGTSAIANEPAPSVKSAGAVTRVEKKSDVPLTGERVDAAPGDFMIRGEGLVAVVSAQRGRLADFGVEGGRDEITGVESTVQDALSKIDGEVVSLGPSADGKSIHLVRRTVKRGITQHVFYSIDEGALKIEDVAVAGKDPVVAVTLGEILGWGNTSTFVEGYGFVYRADSMSGEFVAREDRGVAYAMCSMDGRVVMRFDAEDEPGFHEPARTAESTVAIPAFGASRRRTIALTVSSRSMGDAIAALPCHRPSSTQPVVAPPGLPAGSTIEIARCKDDRPGDPYSRFAADEREITIPEGCFFARATALGYAPGAWSPVSSFASAKDALPVAGTLRFAVGERGGFGKMPAKVLIRSASSPARGPGVDLGEDRDDGVAIDAVYSLGDGDITLPPGKYHVVVERGFEYTADEHDVTIEANKQAHLDVVLERVVDTTGYLSADLHVHAIPSFDAPTPLESRVRSLAAVGVEVAVATDHNAVTDYAPVIKDLKLEKRIASVVGDEITTNGTYWGHFNAFPLVAGAAAIPFLSLVPDKIFAAARAAGPNGRDVVLQVNHPRMGDIGYFELLHLDRKDVRSWFARSPLADMNFDALEVFNGDHYNHIASVERVMKDWYALLDAGFRDTATGNSDSHKAEYQEAGVPRNYVAMPSDDPAQFDEKAFVDSIKNHRVIVSSGPFVTIEANDQSVGGSIDAGRAHVHVRVQAPPWVDVDRVELVKRGEVVATWTSGFGKDVLRLDKTIDVDVAPDDWLLAIARGSKPMTFLYRAGATPFAFTNPIFVKKN